MVGGSSALVVGSSSMMGDICGLVGGSSGMVGSDGPYLCTMQGICGMEAVALAWEM